MALMAEHRDTTLREALAREQAEILDSRICGIHTSVFCSVTMENRRRLEERYGAA
ncbi:Cadherin-89D [Clarias magur]|uniref:Cadherin-89D n=1 Tax=Clarias magur TaxID=1594786 RepID=A0A8J4XFM7_CLAMG|nr:Cadherin-89D [Clarias magur]